MNILLVSDVSITDVIGGAERVLYEQGTRLKARGHVVSVLTRMPKGSFESRARAGGIHEWRYRTRGENPAAMLVSSMQNGRRLFEDLHEQIRFDVINCHQPVSAFAVYRSAAAKQIRKIYTCHSLSFEEYRSRNHRPDGAAENMIRRMHIWMRKHIEKSVLTHSDIIVALSGFTREKICRIHEISSDKIRIIPGGVDLKRFFPAAEKRAVRRRLGIPEDRIVLLTVRNLVPRMGLDNLIRAMDRLQKRIPAAYLVIGGTGPLQTSLSDMVKHMKIAGNIEFAGFIPEDRLPEYYRAADLFVLPTRELEGFGLVTLEAMASGTPVLGTPVGGTPEILGRFYPDLMFEDASAEAMAEKLEKMCRTIRENPSAWADLSQRCRVYAETHYNWENNVKALEEVFAA